MLDSMRWVTLEKEPKRYDETVNSTKGRSLVQHLLHSSYQLLWDRDWWLLEFSESLDAVINWKRGDIFRSKMVLWALACRIWPSLTIISPSDCHGKYWFQKLSRTWNCSVYRIHDLAVVEKRTFRANRLHLFKEKGLEINHTNDLKRGEQYPANWKLPWRRGILLIIILFISWCLCSNYIIYPWARTKIL